MSGESRYAWTHGITPRKFDMINTVDGPDIISRGTRISITFRRVVQHHDDIEVIFTINYRYYLNNNLMF